MQDERFPEQEENPVPAEPENFEEEPLIQELSFTSKNEETSPAEDTPSEEAPVFEDIPDVSEEASDDVSEEVSEDLSEEVSEDVSQDVSVDAPSSAPTPGEEFMSRIPDVEDIPETDDRFTNPDTREPITADEEAMDYQGMLNHGQEEPQFDLSILDTIAEPVAPAASEDAQEYRDIPQEEAAPAPEKPKAAYPRRTRKGRPKKKNGEGFLGIPNILVTFVWLALIVAIGVTAGRMLWVCAADVLAFGREDKPVTVTIYESDTMEDVTNKLYDAGLVRYKSLFNLYANISHAEKKIQPGIYDLNTRYDYHALVNFMTPRSNREVITLTIPEGYTCRQIFDLLEENRICTAKDVADYAATGELDDYWFLEGVERGDKYCLEGYLFPDTYEFYKNSTPREALQRMLNNFDTRFDEEMRAKLDSLNAYLGNLMRTAGKDDAYISQHLFSIQDVTIVASLIEKEAANAEECPMIASVIYNRLFNWGNNPAYLNIDASIIYALDGKADLTTEDLKVDSPFNTYTNVGLTPTPISNPGLASLKGALEPATTNYYFYILNPATGTHQFSTTAEEHESYRAQFAAQRDG